MLPALKLLKKKDFVSVSTSHFAYQPNAMPKMILDVDKEFIYLVDYTAGKTWENLKVNPRISISFSDQDELRGYQVNGRVEILGKNAIDKEMIKKLDERKMSLSIARVISGVRNEKKHKAFEIELTGKFVVYKIKIDDIAEIEPQGDLKRKRVGAQA